MDVILAMIAKHPLYILLALIGTTFSSLTGIPKFMNAVREWNNKTRAQHMADALSASTGIASFTKEDISYACKNYLPPSCMQTDPSDEDELHNIVARAPLFETIDDHLNAGGQKRHLILLADSGMGKTSFCINYYARELKKKKNKRTPIAIVPLGRGDAIDQIKAIPDKRSTICFLDAFDEDPRAAAEQGKRLIELMAAAADFKNIVVTCRSQFFAKDDAVPTGSGIMYAAPRKAGRKREFPLHRVFLAPFSPLQIKVYLKKQFPLPSIYNWQKRKLAAQLVASIPELSARPMLLELVPDLVRERRTIKQLFGLYEFLVEQWLERESEWIEKKDLLEISIELAVTAHRQQRRGFGDRISPAFLEALAAAHRTPLESWKLKSRSLLNRDIEGQFKFAHRSVMEYLFLLAATSLDARCFEVEWTDLMKDLLVSWGNTESAGAENVSRLLNSDHTLTGLFPLASPLREPQRRSNNDCKAILRKSNISLRHDRGIPIAWRNQSLRVIPISSAGNVSAFEVYDPTHGICWLINDISSITDRMPYRDTFDSRATPIATYPHHINIANPVRRLPSIEEIISLWESEPFILENHAIKCIFDSDELYWLGDSGDTGPLCCSFGSTPLEPPHLKLQATKSDSSDRTIHIYEFQNRFGLLNKQPCRAMSIYIMESAD
ncbi:MULTISPECIES: hypothetical protein [unclassified Lysobacter]|uniref:NACHT domain-containing protein n=1 Tax=unclassified Lysobacter TaxID=2635362 RepID=UPI001BEC7545|nr:MULTISPECIES: hypothetical protein [unclassified Lysobacter]MBT2746589.1 hypothetical protein [Lysobacter sp. ISL-42]MBT2753416.1 hypothetical protein [Lysobacter sp. ISL-50]MBT2775526.1 hypothetical protein [Lysobacter sp. ISL-54]MBT2782938.1 hypothetical protein [Lysobacter sp. ISL-52]